MRECSICKTTLCVSVHGKDDNPVYSETATRVMVNDEVAGGFIVLQQKGKEINLNIEELREVLVAAEELLKQYPVRDAEHLKAALMTKAKDNPGFD